LGGKVDGQALISVVDDNDGVRASLDGLVRSLGYRVATFSSAEDFLGSHAASDSRCVISDLQMPGMNGIDLTRAMGRTGSSTPVILISAFLNDPIRREAKAAGVHCFLSKPFDGDALVDCLDSALAA
jgi:FixJ family two-component response regulator